MANLQSMTGFARASSTHDGLTAVCEIRSVNAKNLDVRLRLPAVVQADETDIKKAISSRITRGNLQVLISIEEAEGSATLKVDETAFSSIASAAKLLGEKHQLTPPTTDGILAIRGVVVSDESASGASAERQEKTTALVGRALSEAMSELVLMRQEEGSALGAVLNRQLDEIERLCIAAKKDEANAPEAVKTRLRAQMALLLESNTDSHLDEARLHVEAALLATKADIVEETDRLEAHIAAARQALATGGVIGRKLDFLCQEFNRETNTICSKSASSTLTATGLALKAVIEQFREQVQNLQ